MKGDFRDMEQRPFGRTGRLSERVESDILNYIVEHNLQIGDRLPNEAQLCELFQVGRSTVREAVRTLASKNILRVERGSGTFVVNPSPSDDDPMGLTQMSDPVQVALDLFDVRLMLEPEIAASAAVNITLEERARLQKLCLRVEEAILRGENHVEADIKFHNYIAQCSKNRVVHSLMEIISSGVRVFTRLTENQLAQNTITAHRSIVDAILSGDTVGARCAMVTHLTQNRELIRRKLQ